MIGHGEKMSRKQEQAIAALLSEPTIPAAAAVAGIGEATLWRWLKRAEFQTAYREARREAYAHAVTLMQKAGGQAVQTLLEIIRDPQAPTNSRLSAARAILEMGRAALIDEDLTERVKRLETEIRTGAQDDEFPEEKN